MAAAAVLRRGFTIHREFTAAKQNHPSKLTPSTYVTGRGGLQVYRIRQGKSGVQPLTDPVAGDRTCLNVVFWYGHHA